MNMQYRTNPKNGDQLSALGLGCMRFPRKGVRLDQEKTTGMVKAAIAHGVNYFDTAYIYPGSEEALGTALHDTGLRDKVKIATKLPLVLCKNSADFDKYFNRQLARLKTDRVDYYLMHMLCDTGRWELLKSMGIIEWIRRQKSQGKIINLGFSYHGGRHEFLQLIDAYDWDFCMIQYNYLDEHNQAGKSGLQYAAQKGLPVFVMEPLRGGMLANALPKAAAEIFASSGKGRTAVQWGLRWVWDQPEVTLLLSGMGDITQIEQNCAAAAESSAGCLSDAEREAYPRAVKAINRATKVPCTACGYCMPCPANVDIPTCLSCYNESHGKYVDGMRHYFMNTGAISSKQSNASKCIDCGKCEEHCPQSIEIRSQLKKVRRRLESFWYRPLGAVARKFMKV